jgi:dihydrofolate reductase
MTMRRFLWQAPVGSPSSIVGPLFEWYFNGDGDTVDGGPFKVSKASADYVRPM